MISRALLDEPPILLVPSLACAMGVPLALIVQQVHYWQTNPRLSGHVDEHGTKWVRNSATMWQADNFRFWTADKIRRLMADGRAKNVLVATSEFGSPTDRSLWWSVGHDGVDEALAKAQNACMQNCKMHLGKTAKCICAQLHNVLYTETTTKTTKDPLHDAEGDKVETIKKLPKKAPANHAEAKALCDSGEYTDWQQLIIVFQFLRGSTHIGNYAGITTSAKSAISHGVTNEGLRQAYKQCKAGYWDVKPLPFQKCVEQAIETLNVSRETLEPEQAKGNEEQGEILRARLEEQGILK